MRGEQRLSRSPVLGAPHLTASRIAELWPGKYPLGQFYYDARRWAAGLDVAEIELTDEQVAYLDGTER